MRTFIDGIVHEATPFSSSVSHLLLPTVGSQVSPLRCSDSQQEGLGVVIRDKGLSCRSSLGLMQAQARVLARVWMTGGKLCGVDWQPLRLQ